MRRVLVIRLRSVGDTVLSTPTLFCLRRFLPHATVDVLLEEWVAPLLVGSSDVDEVIVTHGRAVRERLRLVRALRARRYDLVVNAHGGTTATLLARASGAPRRVGYRRYQYSRLLTHRLPPSTLLWGQARVHSVEEQLALVGGIGVPVSDRPATRLTVSAAARETLRVQLAAHGIGEDARLAMLHPGATLATKRWSPAGYVGVARHLRARGLVPVAVLGPGESLIEQSLQSAASDGALAIVSGLGLPEVVALAARAALFVGNDSGVAHIAAAVGAPAVVVFGSSNIAHWHPWASAPAEMVRHDVACAPCPGYTCGGPVRLACLEGIEVSAVIAAAARVLDHARNEVIS